MKDYRLQDKVTKKLKYGLFVDEVVFYDVLFTNQNSAVRGVRFQNLLIFPQSIYSFKLDEGHKLLRNRIDETENRPTSDDFNNMAIKMVNFLDVLDDSTSLTENDIYRIFFFQNNEKLFLRNLNLQNSF